MITCQKQRIITMTMMMIIKIITIIKILLYCYVTGGRRWGGRELYKTIRVCSAGGERSRESGQEIAARNETFVHHIVWCYITTMTTTWVHTYIYIIYDRNRTKFTLSVPIGTTYYARNKRMTFTPFPSNNQQIISCC